MERTNSENYSLALEQLQEEQLLAKEFGFFNPKAAFF